ncbi:DEAD-box ATP-dependent RNA helicase 42-like [Aphis craccivora]|uniref:DEAD-box ATP-dependent RNA helicase 42-like n=1 Tax=Aphis craccivora TaxID=307492 RepID=A0A6G0YEG1_APHCR|nr:DEAD-box ATP-dependent RNA helicase 42-like [Aphis craccivora]
MLLAKILLQLIFNSGTNYLIMSGKRSNSKGSSVIVSAKRRERTPKRHNIGGVTEALNDAGQSTSNINDLITLRRGRRSRRRRRRSRRRSGRRRRRPDQISGTDEDNTDDNTDSETNDDSTMSNDSNSVPTMTARGCGRRRRRRRRRRSSSRRSRGCKRRSSRRRRRRSRRRSKRSGCSISKLRMSSVAADEMPDGLEETSGTSH